MSAHLQTKGLLVRVPLLSLDFQISRLLRARNPLTFRHTECRFTLNFRWHDKNKQKSYMSEYWSNVSIYHCERCFFQLFPLSRFSISRLFSHEQTFFAANIILHNNTRSTILLSRSRGEKKVETLSTFEKRKNSLTNYIAKNLSYDTNRHDIIQTNTCKWK